MIPPSPEVRWHAATSAFDEDEPEISEDTADALVLAATALLLAATCVILAFVFYGVLA